VQSAAPAEVFFIRKRNWRVVDHTSNAAVRDILDSFKSQLLIKYIDRVYLPIKGY